VEETLLGNGMCKQSTHVICIASYLMPKHAKPGDPSLFRTSCCTQRTKDTTVKFAAAPVDSCGENLQRGSVRALGGHAQLCCRKMKRQLRRKLESKQAVGTENTDHMGQHQA
jgi:hypothetical protein